MDNRILFPAIITNIEDPLMIGRVRAEIDSDRNDAILNSITNPPFNLKTDIWGDRDPFIFKPLLPYYINAPLAVGERILVIFANKDFKFDNQYFIQADFSSPMRVNLNTSVESRNTTGSGRRFTRGLSLKNLDGTYRKSKTKGLFVEPQDNGIIGRGSSDIIVKENDVLVRSGKYKGDLNPREFPTPNENRAFLQVSQYNTRKIISPPTQLEFDREKLLSTKFLIEWIIQNPDSTEKFNGVINLYSLKQNERIAINKLNINSSIDDLKSIRARLTFNGLTKTETIAFINNFISNCDNLLKLDDGTQLFLPNEIKYPIFFRPGFATQIRLTGGFGKLPPQNLIDIYNQIKFNKFDKQGGYGFIYSKGSVEIPTLNQVVDITNQSQILNEVNTSTIVGADEIYLLSHESEPAPSKKKIQLDNSLYGIEQDKIIDDIYPNTSSSVRGEELLELINLIVRFLITHAHPFPGLPPVTVTEDGSTINNLLNELSLATKKILNKKIRMN